MKVIVAGKKLPIILKSIPQAIEYQHGIPLSKSISAPESVFYYAYAQRQGGGQRATGLLNPVEPWSWQSGGVIHDSCLSFA